MRSLFGTDGVRGQANAYPMTVEMAVKIGAATAAVLRGKNHATPRKVIIGKDTRRSCYMFEEAIGAGLSSMGCEVYFVGVIPTPAISFLTQSMRAGAGFVISASHNEATDNGIKIFGPDGFKLPDEVELRLEEMIFGGDYEKFRPPAKGVGRVFRIEDAPGRYIVHLKNSFPKDLTLDGIRIVVDTAHGAAYKVAPAVFSELDARVYHLSDKPDGTNINERSGAQHPENMCRAVLRNKAHLGIALDGDADRVIVSDEHGAVVDGDQIMAICAQELLRQERLASNTVVATVMSNIGLEVALRKLGARLVRTAVGDRYVVEAMRAGGYVLGGEQSGHIVFLEHALTGDGILAGLQLLAVMVRSGRPLSELARILTRVPQVLLNVPVRDKTPFAQMPAVQQMVRQVEKALGGDGRVLLRYSGTEMKARVMIEGPDKKKISAYAQDIATAVKNSAGGG